MQMSQNTMKCVVCHQAAGPFYPLGEKDGYRYDACRSCGSAHLSPFPDAGAIEKLMADIDPQAVHVPQPDRQISAIEKILKKSLPAPIPGKNRLLNINAMQGYATVAAGKLGYAATGLNTWAHLHDFATKHYSDASFALSSMQDYAATAGVQHDVILSVKSFGMQTDLDSYTQAIKTSLAPGGTLYIEEDDGNHLNTPRDINDWSVVEPPLTCTILSKKGMEKLLARHGLRIRKSYFTWAPYMRLLVGHAA